MYIFHLFCPVFVASKDTAASSSALVEPHLLSQSPLIIKNVFLGFWVGANAFALDALVLGHPFLGPLAAMHTGRLTLLSSQGLAGKL